MTTADFSGFYVTAKWYVECKRYEGSVDWPTVWNKVAYADSHGADYLLVVTTSKLSPQCKTELSQWQSNSRRPAVRYWEGVTLAQKLMHYPALLFKYGLETDTRLTPASFLAIAQNTSKVIQAAYGIAVLADHDNPALEAAAALSELLTVRIRDVEAGEGFVKTAFSPSVDLYSWIKVEGELTQLDGFDRYGLRVLLALLRHTANAQSATVTPEDSALRVSVSPACAPLDSAKNLFCEMCIWSDLEIRFDGNDPIISRRKQ